MSGEGELIFIPSRIVYGIYCTVCLETKEERKGMHYELLTNEQIQQLLHSWKIAISGSEEQKLIEDLFIITDTPLPARIKASAGESRKIA